MNHNIIIKEGDCDYDSNYDSNSRAVISDIAINHTTGTSSSPSTLYSAMKMDINTNNLEIKEGLCDDGNSSMKSRSISGSSVSDVASSPSTCSSLKNIETSTSRRNSMKESLQIMDRIDSSRELVVPLLLDDVADVDAEEVGAKAKAEAEAEVEVEVEVEMDEEEEEKEEEAEACDYMETRTEQNSQSSSNSNTNADAADASNNTRTTTTTKAQQLLMIENEGLRIECAEDKRKIEQLEEQNEDLLLELASIKMSYTRRATIGGASNNDTSRARVDNKDKDLSVMKKIKPRRRISQLRCVSMHNGHGRRQSNSSTDDSDPSSDEFGCDDGGGGGTSTTRSILRSRSGSGTRPALTRTFSRRVDRRASACSGGDMLRHHNQDNDNDNNYGNTNQDDGMPRLKRTFSRRVVRNKSLSDVETLLSSSSTNMNIDGNIDGNSANSTFNNNNRSATRTTRRESQQSSVRTNRRRSSRNLLGSSSMHGPISGDSIHCPDDGDCTRRISASSKDLLRMFNEE